MLGAAIHGFVLAFGLILPLGVQNVFVFTQGAVQPRFARALPVIITASLCDTLLISLAVLGVSVVVLGSRWLASALLAAGILFLLYMGAVTWRSRPAGAVREPGEALPPGKQVVFAMSVSFLNPHAILDTVGVIGTSSLKYTGMEKLAFALACILVSWIWFSGLALAGRLMGHLDRSGRLLVAFNKVSALIMWGTAAYLATSILR